MKAKIFTIWIWPLEKKFAELCSMLLLECPFKNAKLTIAHTFPPAPDTSLKTSVTPYCIWGKNPNSSDILTSESLYNLEPTCLFGPHPSPLHSSLPHQTPNAVNMETLTILSTANAVSVFGIFANTRRQTCSYPHPLPINLYSVIQTCL